MKRYLLPAIVFLTALGLAGCPSNNQVLLPPPGSVPIARLYVTNDGGSGILDIFASPFSGTSTPAVALQVPSSTDVDDVAFDRVNAYVGLFGSASVDAFALPVTGASTVAFSIATGAGPEGLDVDSSGNLYVAARSAHEIQIFNAPLSGSSTAATTITTFTTPIGVKLDGGGNLYVTDNSAGNLKIFAPPFSSSSTPTTTLSIPNVWGLFVDKSTGNVWVGVRGITHAVEEFTPPISSSSTPALTIASGLTSPSYPTLDSNGNLYVSDAGSAIRVFTAPLSSASTPAFSFSAPDPNGIRFGP